MKLIKQSVELIDTESYQQMLNILEKVARNCYQSQCNNHTQEEFIKRLINMEHYSILEHVSFHFKIITDRSTANQITRHRTGKYAQESQRYCNYSKDKFGNEIIFIEQPNQTDKMNEYFKQCEDAYFNLVSDGFNPEEARCILPNATKTTLMMTMDLRNLRNFLNLRMSNHAQQPIREIATKIYEILKKDYPIFVNKLEIGEKL